jgi:RNA polymerase sigma-70 factor (ECF subfamily)
MEYKLLSDELLVKLLKANEDEAFREVFLRHWQPLFLMALRRIRSREVAEELVQNVFVSLWEKRQTANIIRLECYLKTAIKYQTINYLKSIVLDRKFAAYAVQQTGEPDNGGESILLIHELNAAIDKAARQLPPKTQLVFRLSRQENRSVKEIAESLNISEKTVEYHITQSLKVMRLHLKEFILFSWAAPAFMISFFY